MDNYLKYKTLREQFETFIYHGYEVEEEEESLNITYHMEVPNLSEFQPSWVIPKKKIGGKVPAYLQSVKEEISNNFTLRKLIFSLGMIELISYWKIACPKKVRIHLPFGDELKEEELLWWKEQYFHGLGEFFYTNEIPLDEENFMELVLENGTTRVEEKKNVFAFSGTDKVSNKDIMIPIGGGKDSVVTLELLKENKEHNYCFMINGRGATLETVKVAGYSEDKIIIAKRSLDERMLRLNKEGYLNGHTPFSAIVSFSTVLISYLYGIPYIALSNEGSANESTVLGSTVNHQYSKSFKFEMDFFSYEKEYISSEVHYFSLLRGWTEYRIAKTFSTLKPYHKVFRSCNVGSKEDKWCGHCPKCLFVSFILSPFLRSEESREIFGRDMLEDEDLWQDMRKLIGEVPEKPFECVGSRDEVNISICETIKRMEEEGEKLPLLLARYRETGSYREYKDRTEEELLGFSKENNIPEFLKEKVK